MKVEQLMNVEQWMKLEKWMKVGEGMEVEQWMNSIKVGELLESWTVNDSCTGNGKSTRK